MNDANDLVQAVLAKAESDPAFRAQLIADPRSALHHAFKVEIPASITVVVLQDTPDVRHLVLPCPGTQGVFDPAPRQG